MYCEMCDKPMMAKIISNKILLPNPVSETLIVLKYHVKRTVQHECSCGKIVRKSEASYNAEKRKRNQRGKE